MWMLHCFLLTGEVCAFGEKQQLQWLSDVTEVVQHVLHVLLVLHPTAVNEDEAGHLHSPTWMMQEKVTIHQSITQDLTGVNINHLGHLTG